MSNQILPQPAEENKMTLPEMLKRSVEIDLEFVREWGPLPEIRENEWDEYMKRLEVIYQEGRGYVL